MQPSAALAVVRCLVTLVYCVETAKYGHSFKEVWICIAHRRKHASSARHQPTLRLQDHGHGLVYHAI